MKPAFTHCALHVHDLDASISFYGRYCGMKVVRRHGEGANDAAAWLAEEGRETAFVLVVLEGGERQERREGDMTHYGFAVGARTDIDDIARMAREDGCLFWEPRDLPPPVGYLCAVEDPDGYVIEFSYGQPLGPGADASDRDGGA